MGKSSSKKRKDDANNSFDSKTEPLVAPGSPSSPATTPAKRRRQRRRERRAESAAVRREPVRYVVPRKSMNFCARWQWERKHHAMFTLEEERGLAGFGGGRAEVEAAHLDTRRAFVGGGGVLVRMVRVLLLCLTVGLMTIDSTLVEENVRLYMAYYTHWTLGLCLLYQICVSLMSLCPALAVSPPPSFRANWFVRMTWVFYIAGTNMALMDALWFWTCFLLLLFSPESSWDPSAAGEWVVIDGLVRDILKHGCIGFFCWLDGTVLVGSIPVRWQHIRFVYFFVFLYLIWTVVEAGIHDMLRLPSTNWPLDIKLQAYVQDADSRYEDDDGAAAAGGGNYYEDDDGANQEDESGPLDLLRDLTPFKVAKAMTLFGWNETPYHAAIFTVTWLGVVIPIVYFYSWTLSFCLVRRPIYQKRTVAQIVGSRNEYDEAARSPAKTGQSSSSLDDDDDEEDDVDRDYEYHHDFSEVGGYNSELDQSRAVVVRDSSMYGDEFYDEDDDAYMRRILGDCAGSVATSVGTPNPTPVVTPESSSRRSKKTSYSRTSTPSPDRSASPAFTPPPPRKTQTTPPATPPTASSAYDAPTPADDLVKEESLDLVEQMRLSTMSTDSIDATGGEDIVEEEEAARKRKAEERAENMTTATQSTKQFDNLGAVV